MKTKILELEDDTNDKDVRYFFDEESGKQLVQAASLEKLIERISNVSQPDVVYRDSFLLTHPTFVDPITLLCLLQDRWRYKSFDHDNYTDPELEELVTNTVRTIQLRVFNFLKLWIENHPDVCTGLVIPPKLDMLFNDIKTVYPSAEKTLPQGLASFEKKMEAVRAVLAVPAPSEKSDLLSFSPEDVSKQLTLADHAMFCRIRISELLFENWTKEDKWTNAPNVCKMELRFDAIGQWVANLILDIAMERRVAAISFFIDLANCLQIAKNYFASIAVAITLRSEPISRLTQTWEVCELHLLFHPFISVVENRF